MTQIQQLPQLALLEQIVAALKDDVRVRAAFLRGSFYTGKPDLYSDLDLFVVVDTAASESFARHGRTILASAGQLLWASDVALTPPHLRVLFAGPIRVDLFVVTTTTLPPYTGWRVLFDHDTILNTRIGAGESYERLQPEHISVLCDTFWWTIFSSVGQLKRGRLWMALHMLDECRDSLIQALRWRRDPQHPFESFVDLERYLTAEDQQALAQTLASYDLRAITLALLCAADAFDPAAREIAARVGAVYPSDLAQITKQFFIREFWTLIAPGPAISA